MLNKENEKKQMKLKPRKNSVFRAVANAVRRALREEKSKQTNDKEEYKGTKE